MSILTVAYNSFLFILLLILFFVPINIKVVPYHISLAIIAGIYITGFILSRIYIHNRDKRLAEEHDTDPPVSITVPKNGRTGTANIPESII